MRCRLAFVCLLLGTLTGASVRSRAAETPLSKDRNVLVVVGVAGDLESDQAYGEQLNRLLDILSAPGAEPKSLTLLVESPGSLRRQFSFPAKILSDRRESLLSLQGSDPDLVIAWGHGGQQGDQPVLHVPGPRLTPADFVALAGPHPGKSSDWIMYFRGSLAFAKALVDPERRVLASEGNQTFTYDPIGFPLLLTAFPRAADLPALADLTGKAVKEWYASRSQAATEQPALLGTERIVARVPFVDRPAVTPLPPAAAPATPSPAPTVGGNTPWHGPPAVDPAKYPDAVVLRETIKAVIGDNPQVSQEQDRYLQILTSEGKRFGDLDLVFSPPEENLTILDCEVRQPDGRVETVDTGAHDEEPAPGSGPPEEYPAARRKFFSVPNIAPGAILHLRQRREWKHFPLPKVYLTIPWADEVPILDKTVEVSVPARLPFHSAWKNVQPNAEVERENETASYGTTYRFHGGPIAALPSEPLQPRDHEPALLVSTFADWGEFLTWYQSIARETARATPEMIAKARELTANCPDDLAKIRALFRYVTELRYVAVPLGVNAYRPHAAANVFHHRYGDCKDKANLLNSLLVSQGFDAKLVLAPRFAEALPDVPGAAFNHAISHVDLHGKSLWLDSTDDICRFGLLPPGDPGRRVLLIADREKELRTLPLPPPGDSRLELTRRLTLAGDESIDDEGQCRATGIMDYQLRAAARRTGGARNDHLDLLNTLARPVAGTETLRGQDFLSPAALGEDFTWQGKGTWQGLVSPLPTAGSGADGRFVRLPFLLPVEWPVASQPRTTGLYLNEGYPCEIVQHLDLRLPDNAARNGGKLALPAGGEAGDGPLRYRLQWTQPDPATVQATLTLTLAKADLSADEAQAFQERLRALYGVLAQGLALPGNVPASVHP